MGYATDWRRALFVVFACVSLGGAQEPELAGPPTELGADVDENVDVLARGPVHEAYAEQVNPDPTPGLVVAKAPPDPIDEVPPEWKPDGEDVVWIPGYWFWDDDRGDYVWVSGVWRRVPPDRRWVPGYWQATGAGFQWIAGFWGPATVTELEYAEAPPENLEAGPSSPAPADDHFWIPGNWDFSVGAYRWRPGYWHPYRDSWTWVSARYVWTPRGCIFIPGYWDYTLARRGFLFAPVYFHRPVYRSAGFHYRPTCWIGSDALLMHLFVQPHYNHLYFGDYYAPVYRQRHYIPCYDYHRHHRGYASLYVYYEHHYRQRGVDYCGRVRDWHDYYARHADVRPPHTFRMQQDPGGPVPRKHGGPTDIVVHPYRPERSKGMDRIGGHTIAHVARTDQNVLHRASSDLQNLSRERRRFEEQPLTRQVDRAGGGTHSIVRQDKFELPQVPGGHGRKRASVTLPDAATAPRLPLASDAPSVPRKSGTISRGPGSGDKSGQRRLGEIRRDLPTLDPAASAPDSQRRRGTAGVQDLPLSAGAAPKNRTLPRIPLASGAATNNNNVGSDPDDFTAPPTFRRRQPASSPGARQPMGSNSASRSRKITLPSLDMPLSDSAGTTAGQLPPTVGRSGSRANRSLLDTTPPNLGFPSIHGQSSGPRGQARRTFTPPSLSTESAPAVRRFTPPPTAKGSGGEGAALGARPVFTPPPRASFKSDSAPAGRGRGGDAGGSAGFRSGSGAGSGAGSRAGSGPAAGRGGGRGK